MFEEFHYDPDNAAAYGAEKTTSRTVLSVARNKKQPTRHINLVSAITADKYNHNEPVFVKRPPRFDGSMADSERPIDRLVLNLCVSRTSSIQKMT